MAILILGGAGYIGSHVNKLLSKSGYKTIVIDNLSRGHQEFVKWGSFFKGDISDDCFLTKIISKNPIESVVHLAAYAYPEESVRKPQLYYENNVIKTIKLLDTLVKNNVKQIVFSSSCATFGNSEYVPIDEQHSQKPMTPYGYSKLMIEQVIKDFHKAYGLQYCIFRYFNVVGADPEGEIGEHHIPEPHLLPNILLASLEGESEVSINGNDYPTKDGTCIRDYVDVMDIANAHKLALEWLKNNSLSLDCNLGSGKGYSIKELVKTVEKVSHRKILVKYKNRRPGDPIYLVSSNKKAKDILGWKPSVNIEESIRNAHLWLKTINKNY
jgi:UDP-glucose 4-epimerase